MRNTVFIQHTSIYDFASFEGFFSDVFEECVFGYDAVLLVEQL